MRTARGIIAGLLIGLLLAWPVATFAGWTTPRTWTTNELVTASIMNTHVRDNLQALWDVIGGVQDYGSNWQISTGRQLRMQDSDVAHGMTTIFPTDVYGVLQAASGTDGGIHLTGLSDTDRAGLTLVGYNGSATPTGPAVRLFGGKKNGTGAQVVADTEVLLDIVNYTGGTKFTVYGDGTLDAITVLGGANVEAYSTSAAIGPALSLVRSRGSFGSPAAVQSGDAVANLAAIGYYDGSSTHTGARINAVATENWSSTAGGTRLRFYTILTGAATSAIRAEIDGTGHFIPGADNTYNLGTAGTMRWKDIFAVTKTSVLDVPWGSGRTLISVLEGPEYRVYDSGTVTLDASGKATVTLDARFVQISNLNASWQVLTSGARVRAKRAAGEFDLLGEPGEDVDWQVTATRAGFENVRWRDVADPEPQGLKEPAKAIELKSRENNRRAAAATAGSRSKLARAYERALASLPF